MLGVPAAIGFNYQLYERNERPDRLLPEAYRVADQAGMGSIGFCYDNVRWVERQEGAGSQRFLRELISREELDPADRLITGRASTESER